MARPSTFTEHEERIIAAKAEGTIKETIQALEDAGYPRRAPGTISWKRHELKAREHEMPPPDLGGDSLHGKASRLALLDARREQLRAELARVDAEWKEAHQDLLTEMVATEEIDLN